MGGGGMTYIIPAHTDRPDPFGITPEPWMKDALCAQTDPEAFFPEKGGSSKPVKAICAGCDVRDQFLEYALRNDERFGVWGGLTASQRARLRRTS